MKPAAGVWAAHDFEYGIDEFLVAPDHNAYQYTEDVGNRVHTSPLGS